ncbi:hypothetical protein [Legionella cardiaca]|uniref:Dot/Icm T4SS effector n=1 Tax=Legionella cardiaca TaxID=1071983 RepID=A0ABY8AVL6_9GAMM|nr:hypothetical protein [Legionella cardiaca]WED43555.1 hypothetical protein PXX05_01915 [Legionella cardiaca]
MKAKTEVTSSPSSYKVIFYNFKSDTLWSHSAVEAETYLSAHPITHFNPPVSNEFHDPDDNATKALELWRNIIKPMVAINMAFGEQEKELSQYEYSSVEVPVSKEQFEKAQRCITQQIAEGKNGSSYYSVFRILGRSCGESSQEVLEAITENTPEATLAKRNFFENIAVWPQSHFQRAERVGKARQQCSQPSIQAPIKEGLFAQPKKLTEASKKGTIKDNMEVERLTYF